MICLLVSSVLERSQKHTELSIPGLRRLILESGTPTTSHDTACASRVFQSHPKNAS